MKAQIMVGGVKSSQNMVRGVKKLNLIRGGKKTQKCDPSED